MHWKFPLNAMLFLGYPSAQISFFSASVEWRETPSGPEVGVPSPSRTSQLSHHTTTDVNNRLRTNPATALHLPQLPLPP